MYLNNIDFPNRIIDAIKDDKLVIFAGAGVSMSKPTLLPNFQKLALEIAEGTGETIKKNEPCEVFLGSLKARGIDVNEMAAGFLSNSSLRHNELHEAIVDLFTSPERVKVGTTNYDEMLEQVLKERNCSTSIYNSPALPLGNDINGIVHIHGNVNDSKYMVVTDEDFGRAYLTDGYATRFLIKLFESYTILFIGYSYNDTILHYLTRAMSRQYAENRYILTDDTKSNWKSLGINPIYYPKRNYAVMKNGLIKLGKYSKKSLWDWRNQFIEIANTPPRDLTIESEIDYCLENREISGVLANCINGKEWLELLDKKGVFSDCFSETATNDKNGELWAKWLCDNFLGKDDNSLKLLFAEHRNSIGSAFARLLLQNIIRDESTISDECFMEYITLLDHFFTDQWIIVRYIELTHKRNLHHLSLHLFKKLFVTSIKAEKDTWVRKDGINFKHAMIGDYHHTDRAWNTIKKDIVSKYPTEIVLFVVRTIEELHYLYEGVGQASEGKEPWPIAKLVVEDREKEYLKEPLHILVQAFVEAIKEMNGNEYAKSFLISCQKSISILLRKIALRAIRESSILNYDEKMEILCDKTLVWSIDQKEQVFLLAQNAFKK